MQSDPNDLALAVQAKTRIAYRWLLGNEFGLQVLEDILRNAGSPDWNEPLLTEPDARARAEGSRAVGRYIAQRLIDADRAGYLRLVARQLGELEVLEEAKP